MKKSPPAALVETWFLLANSPNKEFYLARNVAMKCLVTVFGNVDIARQYLTLCKNIDGKIA